MATSGMKKPRSSNFSLNDCLVLAEVMGEESSVEGLSFHAYLKHRFTNTITSTSKREKWTIIASNFKARADVPRDVPSLQKKWDNLVQVHRGMYMDFTQSQRMTGGGPNQKSLTLLTEAVMDVVGRTAANTLGVAACSMDSSMLLLNQLYATTSSTSVSRETLSNTESRMVEHIETEVATAELPTDLSRQPTTMLKSGDSSVQVVCCNCQCHSRLDVLKEEKLKLQIKLLKRKLSEE